MLANLANMGEAVKRTQDAASPARTLSSATATGLGAGGHVQRRKGIADPCGLCGADEDAKLALVPPLSAVGWFRAFHV